MSSFKAGDVVERVTASRSRAVNATIAVGTLGTICRVVTPGRTYRVVYEDFATMCLAVGHDSLRKAPSGSVGPPCPEDCFN